MLIRHDPDEFVTKSSSTTCPFHKANPGKAFAGCTCSASIWQERRSPDEVAAIKRARQIADEERILAQAAGIRARRRREAKADRSPEGQDRGTGLGSREQRCRRHLPKGSSHHPTMEEMK